MRLENLLREKVYTFAQNTQLSDSDEKIIKNICAKENLGLISASLIDHNDNYESYQVNTKEGIFCLKLIAFHFDDDILKRDADSIISLVSLGELDSWGVKYSIQRLIPGQSLAELGKSFLAQNKQGFVDELRTVHQFKPSNPRSFQQFLAQEYLEPNIPSFSDIDFSPDPEVGEICIEELQNVRGMIKEAYSTILEAPEFLHGSICPSRVILNDKINFINFDKNFCGHPLLDILGLKYEFFLHESVESEIINLYKIHRQFSNAEYLAAAKITKLLKFYDLILEYIKQVFLYKGVRSRKILELTEKMSRSFGYFSGLEPFERHREKIAELFVHSVI